MVKCILICKKGQAWGMDIMIAAIIFIIGIMAFYLYTINFPGESEENFELLSYDGGVIMETVLSEGYPENWDSGNVVRIGILSEDKIDENKFEKFYNLANSSYEATKSLFETRFDYFFFLNATMIVDSVEIDGIGKPGTDVENIASENLIKLTRFTIYENKPVIAYLYIWN